MKGLLFDTGVVVAMLDRDDPHHAGASELLKNETGPLILPSAILPEVCYLAHKYLGTKAEQAFIASLARDEMLVDWAEPGDLSRAAEIMAGRPELGFVDAMVICAAERLNIDRIATLDRRHFGSFKPKHCRGFELLP